MKFFQKLENSIAVVLIISFFLPWVAGFQIMEGSPLLQLSGYKIPLFLKSLNQMASSFGEQTDFTPYLAFFIYIIPIASIITIIANFLGKDTKASSTVAGSTIFIILACIIGYNLSQGNSVAEAINLRSLTNMGIGFWGTIIASATMLALKFKILEKLTTASSNVKLPGMSFSIGEVVNNESKLIPNSTYDRHCPNCKTQYDSAYKYCPECGCELEIEETVCPKCKGTIDSSLAFCPYCGLSLRESIDKPIRNEKNQENSIYSEEAGKNNMETEEPLVTTDRADKFLKKVFPKFSPSQSWILLLGIGWVLICLMLYTSSQGGFGIQAKKETTPIEYWDYWTGYTTVSGIKPTDAEKAILWLNQFPLASNSEELHTVNEYVFSKIIKEGGARYHVGWHSMKVDSSHFLVGYIFNPINKDPDFRTYTSFLVAKTGEVYAQYDKDNEYHSFFNLCSAPQYLFTESSKMFVVDPSNVIKIKSDKCRELFNCAKSTPQKHYDNGSIKLAFDYPDVASSAFVQIGLSPIEVLVKFGTPNSQSLSQWEYNYMNDIYEQFLEYNYNDITFYFIAESNDKVANPRFRISSISIRTARFSLGDIKVNSPMSTALEKYKNDDLHYMKGDECDYFYDNVECHGFTLYHYGSQIIHKIVFWNNF